MHLTDHGLSVGIIDTNPLLADGIAALLLQDPNLVSRAEFLGPFAESMDEGSFDVILLDPTQTGASPAEAMAQLRARTAALVGYSSATCEKLARACIAAGFRGILPKTVPFETLKVALATTGQGGIFIDAAFAAAITPDSGVEDPPTLAHDACLSTRELFVLKSVALGKSMKEIGKELDLSSKTIETYKARGTSKLNLSGRRQIVEFAIAQGWVHAT
jgi:two-component system, NarL family, nitrate/nitrite response regulator NarL